LIENPPFLSTSFLPEIMPIDNAEQVLQRRGCSGKRWKPKMQHPRDEKPPQYQATKEMMRQILGEKLMMGK
jgi:hypothetical protein